MHLGTGPARQALIAIGSNQPGGGATPREVVRAAQAAVEQRFDGTVRWSRLFRTPAFPPGSGPDYVNGAAVVDTAFDPQQAVELLHDVEAAFGRVRGERWSARVLDLDLIGVGDAICPDLETYGRWRDLPLERQRTEAPEGLILPHPRVQDRAFVLGPLREVAPDWRHPVLDRTVEEMWQALPEALRAELVPLEVEA